MVTIKGSYVGNRRDGAEAIEFFRRGLIKAPYKVVGLSELPKGEYHQGHVLPDPIQAGMDANHLFHSSL
jgi:hypothetical protein